MTHPLKERAQRALGIAQQTLLDARGPEGRWIGHLSSSALSTATATCALAIVDREKHSVRIAAGLRWLAANSNADGGWGDTTKSLSNLSTTTLCWAAFAAGKGEFPEIVSRAERWITERTGGLEPEKLAPAIIARYGKDRTFSVPILTMCALAGRLGVGPSAWKHVIPLPFELAACPHQLFAALRLPVVSYALPALIAMGIARHVHLPSRNPLLRLIRNATTSKTLRVLASIQPSSGGFLEATPLTSFVTMSLAGSGLTEHPVAKQGVDFLESSQRQDGSWAIDTNLATWITTLSVNSLGSRADASALSWLLRQQYHTEHPYSHAAAGGWAWTDLPGGVPDADDTAGALLALHTLAPKSPEAQSAAIAGIKWLVDLQNSDGGIPTFCRGWGALPFDHSSADITAHALRAWRVWKNDLPDVLQRRVERATTRALQFLKNAQRPDGSWVPLWFGNQHAPNEENPTYGTSRVLLALAEFRERCDSQVQRGTEWLLQARSPEGAWGGAPGTPASIEETALALEALAKTGTLRPDSTEWLIARVESGEWKTPSPIGFYFARLWYYEELYPLIFTTSALREIVNYLG